MKFAISSVTVYIIAFSLCVAIFSYALFQKVLPTKTAASYEHDYGSKLDTEGQKMKRAKDRVQKAIKMVEERADVWNGYVATKTPPTSVGAGGINLAVNPYSLLIDTNHFRNSVQRAVNAQIKKGGVKVIQGPYVNGPTDQSNVSGLLADYYHFPAIKFPIVIFNLGQVQVQGTYAEILANMRAYKNMPHYLAVADGLRLDGTSPLLTGTYNLTVVGFLRGTHLFGSVPEEAAGGAGQGAPGGPGGFGPGGFGPGGFPGGPGGRGGPGGSARGGGGGPVASGVSAAG